MGGQPSCWRGDSASKPLLFLSHKSSLEGISKHSNVLVCHLCVMPPSNVTFCCCCLSSIGNQCLPLHFCYPSIPQFTTSAFSAVVQLAQVDTGSQDESLELSSGVTEPVGTPNEHCCLLKSAKPENLCKYRRIYRPIKFLTKSAMLLWKLCWEQCYRNHMKKKKNGFYDWRCFNESPSRELHY